MFAQGFRHSIQLQSGVESDKWEAKIVKLLAQLHSHSSHVWEPT